MFPTSIETVVSYKQKEWRQQAERIQLINGLQRQNSNTGYFQKITNWIGLRLTWGQSELVPKKQVV